MKITNIFFIMFALLISGCTQTQQNEITQIQNPIKETRYILALGDSLTAGYGLSQEDSYPTQLQNLLKDNGYDYQIINAGKSGDTSSQVLERVEWSLEDRKYDLVILVVGGNDGLRGLSTNQMKENIGKIIDKIQEKNIKVVIGGMKIPTNYGSNYISNFEKVYPEVAKEKQIPLIDFFLSGVALDRNLNLEDGIHPNRQGYSIISNNLFNFLKQNNLIQKQ